MSKKKHISLILAIMMVLQLIVPQVPLQAKSSTGAVQRSKGQKIGKRSEIFEFKNTEKERPSWFTMRTQSLFGARDVGLTKSEKVKIETAVKGLDDGDKEFNWEAFGQNKKFEAWVEVAYKDEKDQNGDPIRHKVSEVFDINTASTIDTTITVDASKAVDNYYIVTDYDKDPDSFKINAFFQKTTIVSDKGEKSIAFKLDVQQIVSTKITYNLIDEYGKEIDLNDAKEAKPAEDDLKGIGKIGNVTTFDLKKEGTENLWQEQELDEFELMDSSLALSLTKDQVTSGGIDYKLTSTYDVINGGTVTIKRQKDVVTPKDPHNPGNKPEGYARINLSADALGSGPTGTFTKDNPSDTQRVVDVRAGKPYTVAKAEIDKQGKPFPLTNANKVDTGKTFKAWDPELNTLGNAVADETKTLHATYQTSKEEIIPYLPGEQEPTKDKDGLPIPTDYVKVTFKSESETKGKVKIGDKEGATVLAKVKPGIDLSQKPEITTAPAKHYGFTKWDPALTKAAADQTYTAYFVKSGEEIGKTDPIPKGWYRVTVSQDAESIQAGTVETKYYPVEPNGKLAEDKFPSLTNAAKDGYKDPAWYVGSDKVEKPYEMAINASIDFIARATELESHKITKDNGLKAVDFTAYKGDEMDEDFWKKGVKLEKANDSLQKLLDKATVADQDGRTTAEAGEKVGTLKVTFKDGSTIDVQNQKLTVIDTKVDIDYDKDPNAKDDANAPRHKDEVVKGKIKTSETVEGAKVEILDKDNKLIGITLANADGSFIAGTRELQAGETIKVRVTLPKAGKASDAVDKVVKLNADRLKELLPIAKAQKESFNKKQNAFIKKKLEALDTAITEAEKLVDKNYKPVGEDKAENQTAIDNAVTALEKALKELTANIPPTISGPKTHEIFVGEDLDLKALVDVTDGDGADDLVVENGSNVKITAVKVEGQNKTPVTDFATIKDTVGTYKVTYTAKDKSNAEVTHEMTLTVKPRTNSAIEVTKDPTNMSYLIKEKNGTAKLNLKGMTLNLVDNLGKKTKVELTDKNVTFKVNGKVIKDGGDLTLADDVQFIEVEYKDGDKTLKAQTKGVLRVGPDYDKDGTDDRTQNFDPKNIEKLEVIKQPQLYYIAKDKSEAEKVFKLNLEGMIVRMTDKAGKEKLAVVKKDGKFYDYDEPTKEITQLTATPAHGATLTPQTGTEDAKKGDNGKKVAITGPNNSKAETDPLKVFYDANGDKTPDYEQGQKTPAPSAMARNVGENPQGTTVEGMATPGAVIKITDAQGKVLTTEPEKVIAGTDGKYTATVKPILADGTEIKVTAKLGEMEESDKTPTKVFDDKNNNKQPDKDEGFNIAKATDIKFVEEPDLTYLVKTKETEVTFDGKDGKGKAIYLELSYKNGDKTESKIMTLEDLMKDTENIKVTPANGTKDKIELDKEQKEGAITEHKLVGKAIEVKLVKADKTATSTSKFAIEIDADDNKIADKDETTPSPTAKALNVGKEPTSTTITGKAVPGAKVVAKATIENKEVIVGEATADPTTGVYTINATKNGKTDGGALDKDTPVNVTAKDGEKQTSKPTEAIVKEDKDGNGVDDDKEKFNIKKATKVEIIKNPDKMDYLVNTTDGKAKFETKGLVVKFTDDSGKSATYTAEELANMSEVTINPANNEEIGLTPEGKTNKMDLTVTVTGAEATDKPTAKADRQVIVKLDADKNGTADEDEQTPEPTVTARNIGTDGPDGKKVPATKTTVEIETEPKAKVTIEYTDKDGQPQKIENLTAGKDGKLTQEIEPKLKDGTDVKVTVQDGEKKPTDKTVKVFEDLDDNKIPDNQAGQTERPAAIASNKGKNPTFTTIEGKTEKGAVITVTLKDGSAVTVENLVVNDDGTYTLEAKYDNKPLENGAEILVYAKNAPKTISKPQTTTVFNDVNKDGKPDGGKVDLTDVKDIQVIAPDKMSYTQGEKLDGTGLKAVIRDNGGNIEIFEYDNATGKFKNAENEEVAEITATVDGKAIKDLALTEKDHNGKAIDVTIGEGKKAKKGSTNQKLEVKELQTPTPTIEFAANQNTIGSDGKTPTQTEKAKTTVKFTVKNKPTTVYVKYTVNGEAKEESFDIGANDEATKTVDLQVKLPEGAVVQVLAKDADKTLSEPAITTVVRDANNDGKADPKYLQAPTINPIRDKQSTVSGEAKDAEFVDIYKKDKNSGEWVLIKENETVSKDKFSYTNPTSFNDGDEIKVVAKRPNYVSAEAITTVGVDTSGLDKAIQDGKDALDKDKGGKNNGTPEDKALKDAIKKGEDLKKQDPAPTQDEVDKAQKDIEKAIDNKKKADEARDKLQEKIDEANDKKNDPAYPTKPDDVKKELDDAAKEGQKVHDDNNKSKEDIDKEIKKIQEKIDQYNKQQIGVNIRKVTSNDETVVVTVTAPNAKIEVFKSEINWSTYEEKLTLIGKATSITRLLVVSLKETLPKGTDLVIKVTHPDYLSYEEKLTVE